MLLYKQILLSEAIAAINRTAVTGLEGNLATLSALGANCVKERTRSGSAATASGRILAGIAAILAALGLVCEALFLEKFLILCGKDKFGSAVFACNFLIC